MRYLRICFVKLKPHSVINTEDLSGEYMSISFAVLLIFLALEGDDTGISDTVLLAFLRWKYFRIKDDSGTHPWQQEDQTSPCADLSPPVISSVPFPLLS